MNISKAALLVFAIGLCQTLQGQTGLQPYNKAVIWRGFEHQWTYNHRCNRIGDYVQSSGDSVISVHTSATGTGNDSTVYASYYSAVSTPDAVFYQGQAVVKIHGDKDSLIVVLDTVEVSPENWLQDKAEYVSVLNGFDLRSTGIEAQKIQVLYVTISDGDLLSNGRIRLIIKTGMVLNCKTAECKICNRNINYDLTVYYLLAGLNKQNAAASSQLFVSSYTWNKKNELREPPLRDYIKGCDFTEYRKAAVGIKGFMVVMDQDHWLLQWNNSITPKEYNPGDAKLGISVNELFKEWRPGMKKSEVAKLDSRFSVKQKGWAITNIDAVMFQFKNGGEVKDRKASGHMYWPGKNEAPGSALAIGRSVLPF